MSFIKTYLKHNRNILRINFERKSIDSSPEYQRNGDIWNTEKRQLLIDSIINNYDIPKLYFHVLNIKEQKATGKEFAIIDGRQRLETIWKFIDGDFALAEDFTYYKDPKVKAGNMTYKDLAKHYPDIKGLFDSSDLPIICVETDDLDLIEDMFLRLNEAVPLNSAEKRNAIGGPMTKVINDISANTFFKNKVAFKNNRYQHKEVAAKLIFLEWTLTEYSSIVDTKKSYLDSMVKVYKKKEWTNHSHYRKVVRDNLARMNSVFINNDELLRSQSIIPIYYLVTREANFHKQLDLIHRKKLLKFRDDIKKNKLIAEASIKDAKFDFLEFSRLSLQGTNDASSIKERSMILKNYLGIQTLKK